MPDLLVPILWLCLAALAAGAINSLAGGGTLLTFPTLIAVLATQMGRAEAEVFANATSTAAVVTGSIAGAWGYRKEAVEVRHWLTILIWPSVLGGVAGSLLLTRLDPAYFSMLVPWLVLAATALFLAEPLLRRGASERQFGGRPTGLAVVGLTVFQFLVATYGGYFGAGIGILMITSLTLMHVGHIHQVNALKTILAACINGMAVIVFVVEGKIFWMYALPMAVAAIAGGFLGAKGALRIPRRLVRAFVVCVGFGLAIFFFTR